MEVFTKIFYGGLFVGSLIGMSITCIIALVVLEIEDRKDNK